MQRWLSPAMPHRRMAETTKLSVEKALEKLRGGDDPKSKNEHMLTSPDQDMLTITHSCADAMHDLAHDLVVGRGGQPENFAGG